MMASIYKLAAFLVASIPESIGKFSDHVIAKLLQYIIRYRATLINKQLQDSFPEKSVQDIARLKNRYYIHLANILRTSLASLHWSKSKIIDKVHLHNIGCIAEVFALNKPIILIGGHQGNWELCVLRISLQWDIPLIGIYKPIKEKPLNDFLKKHRSRFGMELIPIRHTARGFIKRKNESALFFLLGDQSPDNMKEAIWQDFMGRETAWLHGLERYSHLTNAAVVYFSCTPADHDRFVVSFELLTNDVNSLKHGEITAKYAEALEKSIQSTPWNWLWSHNRWKRKKVQ